MHDLKNRFLHIYYQSESVAQSAKVTDSKCNSCTLEELAILQEIKSEPRITPKALAEKLGKSERTIKTNTVVLQEKGCLVRENGKRNGRWRVLIEIP